MRKYTIIVISMFILLTIFGCSKSKNIDVENNDTSIQKGIAKFIENEHRRKTKVTIENSVTFGADKYITFTTDDKDFKSGKTSIIGIGNNKYSIISVDFTNLQIKNLANAEYKEIDDKPYVVAIFEKYNIQPKKFKCKIGKITGNDYKQLTFEVPNTDYGIQVIEIDQTYNDETFETTDYRFYDENNVDITDKLKLAE